jgi:hypothetical protein
MVFVNFLYIQFTLDELGTSFAFVVSSIFANRLLISIRLAYFEEEEYNNTSQLPSINFAENDLARHKRLVDTTNNNITAIELTTFNERIGV